MTIARRSFFTGSVLLAIASLAGPAMACADRPPRRIADRLRALSGDPASARVLGEAYAELYPCEMGQELPELILSSLSSAQRAAAANDDDALIALIAERVREDFAQGSTVVIDGWLLSRTEARLCALWI